MIIFYVPCKDEFEAEKIANQIIQENLAYCANIIPKINSIYKWEGEIKKEKEAILIIKAQAKKEDEIRSKIEKLHSYKVPAIISFLATTNELYLENQK